MFFDSCFHGEAAGGERRRRAVLLRAASAQRGGPSTLARGCEASGGLEEGQGGAEAAKQPHFHRFST